MNSCDEDKNIVLNRYPGADLDVTYDPLYGIWEISKYPNLFLGKGKTECEAWKDAVRRIQLYWL
jgi:hypothetical protein